VVFFLGGVVLRGWVKSLLVSEDLTFLVLDGLGEWDLELLELASDGLSSHPSD
jgi:hypothetical protein